MWILGVFCVGWSLQICLADVILKGPPKVETNPKLSSSYIPAAMQIIAHDTELMKYVIKPPEGGTTTTTTTQRPTRPHKPALFAPSQPLGPSAYFSSSNNRSQYVQLQQQPAGLSYFDRYPTYLPSGGRGLQDIASIYEEAQKYLGKGFGDVLKLANRLDPESDIGDEESRVQEFTQHFEDPDSSHRYEVLSRKKIPPTKAYVTLLSLYDSLNKESKKLMLNKYAGYTNEVLDNLVAFSGSTSSYQLKNVLKKLLNNGDTKRTDILDKIKTLIADLEMEGSYINKAIKDIPPLVFAH